MLNNMVSTTNTINILFTIFIFLFNFFTLLYTKQSSAKLHHDYDISHSQFNPKIKFISNIAITAAANQTVKKFGSFDRVFIIAIPT